eukprot:3955392-Amphidinium_carterae.1
MADCLLGNSLIACSRGSAARILAARLPRQNSADPIGAPRSSKFPSGTCENRAKVEGAGCRPPLQGMILHLEAFMFNPMSANEASSKLTASWTAHPRGNIQLARTLSMHLSQHIHSIPI